MVMRGWGSFVLGRAVAVTMGMMFGKKEKDGERRRRTTRRRDKEREREREERMVGDGIVGLY